MKTEGISDIKCLLRLNFSKDNETTLKEYQIKLFHDFQHLYNATIIIILSDQDKKFAFFLPSMMEKTVMKETDQ